MTSHVFDQRSCQLGEGPLWHPERNQLFWFDIIAKQLLSQHHGQDLTWQFDEHVSAAGWIDVDTLLIASETALFSYNLETGKRTNICGLEADNPITRSNDGRADPWGGFWIGTMGKMSQTNAGAIYRFFKGELRKLVPNVTVSNAICFAPDRSVAYYTDTMTCHVMRVPLDPMTGWPNGDAVVHLDLTADGLNPDGAVTDVDGNLWLAEWASSRVCCYAPNGDRLRRVDTGSAQTTCPAFGGPEMRDLYVTSAADGLSDEHLLRNPDSGKTFVAFNAGQGRPEPRVVL